MELFVASFLSLLSGLVIGAILGKIFLSPSPPRRARPAIGQFWHLDGVGPVHIQGLNVTHTPSGEEAYIISVEYAWNDGASRATALLPVFFENAVLINSPSSATRTSGVSGTPTEP